MVDVGNGEVKTYWFRVNPSLLLVKETGFIDNKWIYS